MDLSITYFPPEVSIEDFLSNTHLPSRLPSLYLPLIFAVIEPARIRPTFALLYIISQLPCFLLSKNEPLITKELSLVLKLKLPLNILSSPLSM